jgi:hypothetical protein
MKKSDALAYIKTMVEQHIITRQDVLDLFEVDKKDNRLSIMLYYIGGIVIFLGIAILVSQNWNLLSNPTKIIATLGSGFAAYIMGVLFDHNKMSKSLASAFYAIAGLVLPIGLYVVFDIAGFDVNAPAYQTLISGLLFLYFMLSFIVIRDTVFLGFFIFFGTWLFFAVTDLLLQGNPIFNSWTLFNYKVFFGGLSYLLLAYYFSQTEKPTLISTLYFFGALGLLGSALFLGDWKPDQSIVWELFFPFLVFGMLLLSVFLQRKILLILGTIFLMFYIIKITYEYFVNSLGWPFALVLAGLLLMCVGYFSLNLKRRYL